MIAPTGTALGYGPVSKELLYEGLIPPEAGVTLRGHEGLLRPYGFTPESLLTPHALLALDEHNHEVRIPSGALPGIIALPFGGLYEDDQQTWYTFRNYKQQAGLESQMRTIRPTGIGWGVHPGHRGLQDGQVVAAPEEPTFYIEGEQVGLSRFDEQQRLVTIGGQVGSRAFSMWRIQGLVGDPTDPAFRDQHGIY